jgi:hypothetical protein
MSEPKPKLNTPVLNLRAIAFLGAAALAWAVCGLLFAALAPRQIVPRLFYSYHVEHFVAFYIVALLSAAGLTRVSVRLQWLCLAGVALVLWGIRMLIPIQRPDGFEDFMCDIAGAAAALAPLMLGRIQQRSIMQ